MGRALGGHTSLSLTFLHRTDGTFAVQQLVMKGGTAPYTTVGRQADNEVMERTQASQLASSPKSRAHPPALSLGGSCALQPVIEQPMKTFLINVMTANDFEQATRAGVQSAHAI